MKKFFITLSIIGSASAVRQGAWSQLTLTTQTANQYVANLVGNGITYSNVVFNGDPAAIRAFSNGNTTNLGLTSGVVMSTGLLNGTGTQSLSGPSSNFLSGNNGGGSYPELNAIAGSATYDGLVLEFDFVPVTNQLNVEFVFGSEEYNEYVNSGFNDAFAFFISGPGIVGQQNIALVPNTSLPVTIDNINNGNWWWCSFGPCFNCAYYIDNCNGTTLAMDGFTTVLTASRTVIPCSTYHIRLMIADGGDAAYDSWVFLKQDGFYSVGATGASVTTTTLIPGGTAFEGCGNNVNYFTFSIPAPVSTNTTINFTIGGTATNGLDYQAIPNSITIPAGQTSANLFINAINDGIVEPNETVILTVPLNACSTQTYTLTIADPVPLNVNVPPNVSYCAGGPPVSITATPSGGLGNISYSWSNGAGTGQTISVNPGSTTTYTVTATDACGTTATAQTTVAVVPAPSSAFSMPSTGCVGQPVTITYTGNAPPGATYNWNFGAATVQSGSGQGPYTVTFPNTGSFNVSLTVIHNGCTSATTTQNIQISNAFTSTFSAPANICAGQTATITYTGNAPANATYNWNFGGGTVLSGSGQGPYQVQFNTPGTPTITLSVASGSCTSSTTSVPITVNQIPTSTFTVTSPVCVGQNATVTYTGNGGNASVYNWNFAGGNAVPGWGMGPHQVSWNAPGTYTITLTTNLNGCISPPTSVNVDVISAPTSTFSISPNPPCAGQNVTVTYTGNASAGATYSWNFGGGVIVSGSGQGPYVINFPSAQNYNISLQVNQGGCISTTTTQTVAVTQPPTSSFTTSSPICFGQNLTVNYTGNAPPGATYNWNFGGATVVSGNGPGPYNLSFPSPGSYTLSLQVNNNGCQSNTTTQNVVVNPGPSASFTVNPGTLCEGQAATVTYTGNAGAGATYTWNFGGGTVQSGSGAGPYQVSWATGGNYTVSLTVTQNGCTSTPATQAVTVNAIPTASFSLNPATVCAGQPVTITYTGSAGAGAVYNWNFGGGTVQSGSGAGPYQVSWSSGGSYTVTLAVSENGCASVPVNQSVTVNSIPSASFTVNPGTLCEGQAATVSYTGNAGAGATYTWNFGGGTVQSGSGAGPYQVSWATGGNYTVSLTVTQNGCTSTPATQAVTVNAIPTASFSLNPATVCAGQPVTITYTGSAGAGAVYNWDFGGGTVQSGSGAGPYQVSWTAGGSFSVSLSVTANGCTSPPNNQNVTINSIPTSSFTATSGICPGQNSLITYTGTAGPGATYNWSFSGGTVASGSGPGPYQVNWLAPGTYTISLTVIENGCTSSSTTQQVVVSNLPSAAFSINPNPVCVNQPVTITYTGGANNATFSWNFGGGIVQSGSGGGPYTVIYNTANTFTVSLQVNVGGCLSPPQTQTITVNPIPTSSFSMPVIACAQNPVTITYTGNAGAGATYNWSFDMGTVVSGSGQGPYQVEWSQVGVYIVSLQVIENGCVSATTALSIGINPTPVASFSVNPSPACVGQPVTITYTGNSPPNVSYTYNFPGGNIISGIGQGPFQVIWPNAGTYNLTLMVIASGCTSQVFNYPLTVNNPPTSSFTVNPNAVCAGQSVTITYSGNAGANASFNWDFGGGTIISGSGTGPYQVQWPSAGAPNITLTVTENGCTSTPTSLPVTVYPIPSASFTASSPLCPGQLGTISYTGTASPVATYAWNFGGGTVVSGTGQGPYQVHWNSPGNYSVSLTVTENGCISPPYTQNVVVHSTPLSTFSVPNAACEDQPVIITYTGTSSPGAIYSWNFGGGTILSGSGQGPYQVSWSNPGTATISLTVIENGCQSLPTSQSLLIHPIPSATFTSATPVCAGANSIVTYTGTASGNALYQWDFGNATLISGSGQGPYQISWNNPGQYTVSLVVTENGCTSPSYSQAITVNPIPTASFSLPSSLCEGQPGNISYNGTGGAGATFQWNFGGGNVVSGSGAGPYQVSWNAAGTYNISLTVTENGCQSNQVTQSLTVYPIPTANFSVGGPVCPGDGISVTYTGTATAGAIYDWNFGGGSIQSGSGQGPFQILYPAPGQYNISLTVSENGCVSPVFSQVATVLPSPSALFTATPAVCEGQAATINYTGGAGAGATFIWNFDNGTILAGSGPGPYQVSWNTPGTHQISLTVVENNCSSPQEVQHVVVHAIPTADFTVMSPVCEDQGTILTYTGSASAAATYVWFADGGQIVAGSGSGPITMVWNTAGTYNPSLTVTENGCTSQPFVANVTVQPIPTSSFTLTPSACVGQNAVATYTGTASQAATYSWTITGGGQVQSGSGPGPIAISWSNAGNYSVELVVQDGGCVSQPTIQNITVHPIPTATFNINPAAICSGQATTLTYTGTAGPGATYSWNFGGGTVVNGGGAGPYQVQWNTPGSHTVTLTVTENGCTSQPQSINVTVYDIPTSSFTVANACQGQASAVTYTGTASPAASYQWNFGTGVVQSGSGAGPYQILWNVAGNTQVTLVVTENGCSSTTTVVPVTVYPLPVASFTYSNPLCVGNTTSFSFTGTAGPTATYNWNFGNGVVQSGTGAGPYQVLFPNVGSQQISLIVSENGCTSAPYNQTITVNPIPSVSIAPVSPQCVGMNSFDFSAQGNWGPGATFQWFFPNGNPSSSTQQNPQNISWNTPGIYGVQLMVTENGCSGSAQEEVTVYADPVPQFTASPLSGCEPLDVQFSNTTNGYSPMQATWNLGNGVNASGDQVSTTYTQPGSYTVSLTVTDAYGCVVTTSMPGLIQVHPRPVAGFAVSPMVMDIQEPNVVVTDHSQFATQWHYTFGDGAQSWQQNPAHNYQNIGGYTITQVVYNAFGCSDTASLNVVVNPVSEIFVPNSFSPNGDGVNDVWLPIASYVRQVDIWVFDRWGQVVFHSDDVYHGWDGTYRNSGEPMKQDTYVYLIEYKNYAGKLMTLRGSVTLVR